MNNRILLLSLILLFSSLVYSQGLLAPAQLNNKTGWGFIDEFGDFEPLGYKEIKKFQNGYAQARIDGDKWVFVSATGRQVGTRGWDAMKSFSEEFAGVRVLGGWAFINMKGELISDNTYQDIKLFMNNVAFVKSKNLWGMIDTNGVEVFPCKFEKFQYFNKQGNALVKENGMWGLINRQGEYIIDNQFLDLKEFNSSGLAFAQNKKFKWGCINRKGEWIVEPEYNKVLDFFYNGIARVQKGNLWCLLDSTGNKITAFEFSKIEEFNNGIAVVKRIENVVVENKKGKVKSKSITYKTYLTDKGKVPSKEHFSSVGDFSGNYGVVEFGGEFAFMNRQGEIFNYGEYDHIKPFSNGIAVVLKNERWGVVNEEMEEQGVFQYDKIVAFDGDVTIAKLGEKWGYIDKTGDWMIEPIYNAVVGFVDDIRWSARFKCSYNKELYLTGSWMYDAIITGVSTMYEESYFKNTEVTFAKVGALWGVIDIEGNWVIEPSFEFVRGWANDHVRVRKNGKWGIINKQGMYVVPCRFNHIEDYSEICN